MAAAARRRAPQSGDIDEQAARAVAATPVVTVASSGELAHAAQIMVDRAGSPVGVLSTLDVARALVRFPERHPVRP